MKKLTAKYVDASELFTSLGFDELESDFWYSDLHLTHRDMEISLVRMYKFLLEIIRIDSKDSVAFVQAVHKLPNYDPHMYVNLEN